MDGRALRKAYSKGEGGASRWDMTAGFGLVENGQIVQPPKARKLVDRLVTAVAIVRAEFSTECLIIWERQICDHLPKKNRRLERECERMEEK